MAEKSQNFWTEGIKPQKKLYFGFWPPCWVLLRCWWTRIRNLQRTAPSTGCCFIPSIAINGLLFHYKPTSAVVTVDGETHTYHHVWLAPTMVMYGKGKLKPLTVFPSIFKGAHIRHNEMVEVLTGHHIHVEFDRPTPPRLTATPPTSPPMRSLAMAAALPDNDDTILF